MNLRIYIYPSDSARITLLFVTEFDYEYTLWILRRKIFLHIRSQIILSLLPRLGNIEINSIVTHTQLTQFLALSQRRQLQEYFCIDAARERERDGLLNPHYPTRRCNHRDEFFSGTKRYPRLPSRHYQPSLPVPCPPLRPISRHPRERLRSWRDTRGTSRRRN